MTKCPLWPEMQPAARVKNDGYQLLKMKNESSNHSLPWSSPTLELLWLENVVFLRIKKHLNRQISQEIN